MKGGPCPFRSRRKARMVLDPILDPNAAGRVETSRDDISCSGSQPILGAYDKRYPGKEQFTGGSACSGLYRGMKLWAAAVNEAGSLRQEDVIATLDHARIAEGPGGPAEMVPGQHHVRMNMYIAQAKNGRFEIVENLGAIDPDEAMVPSAAEFGRGPIA
jgi:branched-chain amino acid transport system substrate-binding protein